MREKTERLDAIAAVWPKLVSADVLILTRPIQIQADTLVVEVFDRQVRHKHMLQAARRCPPLLRPNGPAIAQRVEPPSTVLALDFLAQDILDGLGREAPAAAKGIKRLRFRAVPRPLHLRLVS